MFLSGFWMNQQQMNRFTSSEWSFLSKAWQNPSDVPIPVNSDSSDSKNVEKHHRNPTDIHNPKVNGRFSMLKLVQNFFHDQHLNHITVLWCRIIFPKMAAKSSWKISIHGCKKILLCPQKARCPHPLPRRHTAHRCFDLLGHRQKNHRMVLLTIPLGVAINPPGEVNEQKKSRK